MALSARSGLKDKRPLPEDKNVFKDLLARHRGFSPAAKVITRILRMFRDAGSHNIAGPQGAGLYQKALWLIWSNERENSFLTVEKRKAGSPAFPVTEVEQILFISGRKLSDGPPYDRPSIHQQGAHLITPSQQSQFMVPIVNPSTALGLAVAQELHDECCGASPATSLARAARYFHFVPSAGPLFRDLQDTCYKCRRIRLIKGRDLISPLRHLSDHNMVQGFQLQLDIAGPWWVYTKAKNYAGQLRGNQRNKTKMWLLLCIDYFTGRLEVSPLEDLTTGSVSAAIQEVISSTG